jgi:hypothetical protein
LFVDQFLPKGDRPGIKRCGPARVARTVERERLVNAHTSQGLHGLAVAIAVGPLFQQLHRPIVFLAGASRVPRYHLGPRLLLAKREQVILELVSPAGDQPCI